MEKTIENAEEILKANLETVARVYEWARLLEYNNTTSFSDHFVKQYRCRPSEKLTKIRLESVIKVLRSTNKKCLKVAWEHSMDNEKELYNFTTYHLGISPTKIRSLPQKKFEKLCEEFM